MRVSFFSSLHPCSNCHSYSLASICPYTQNWIPVQLNLPYAHLRYLFEGYRPSQTNKVTQSELLLFFQRRFFSLVVFIFRVVFHFCSSFSRFAPTYSTQISKNSQCNPSVKVYGVFSSTSQLTVSSLLFQFH